MDELEKGYFNKNNTNPYQQGEGSNGSNGQPPTLNDNWYSWQSIRSDNMKIVAFLVGYYFLNAMVQALLMFIQIIISGGINSIIQNITADLATGDFATNDSMAQATEILQTLDLDIGTISIISGAIAVLIFLPLRGKRLFTTDIFSSSEKIKFSELSTLFIVAFSAQFVFLLLSLAFNGFLSLFGISTTNLMEEAILTLYTPAGFLYIILLGPIIEEIIFRGAIMRTLEKHGKNYAVIMSSLFFGLFHVFLLQGAFAFCVGLILGYTAMRYSMKWAIVIHVLVNGCATLMDITLPVWAQSLIFALFFVSAVLLFLKNKSSVKVIINQWRPILKDVYKIAFSSGFLITAIAIVVFFGILLS